MAPGLGGWTRALALSALLACGGARAEPGAISGTVHAPAGQSGLSGTFVVACWAGDGRCNQDAPQTRATRLDAGGDTARFRLGGLQPGPYILVVLRDVNGSGGEDPGDWAGDVLDAKGGIALLRPGATVEVRMRVVGAKAPADAPAPQVGGVSKVPPPPVPPGSGGLFGAWEGVKENVSADPDAIAHGLLATPGRDWLVLLKDGHALTFLPSGGLGGPIDWAECGEKRAFCPSYSVQGSRIRVVWPSGYTRVYLRQRDGSLRLKGIAYEPLSPLDGVRLDGRFGVPGNEYAKGFIVFHPDGSFTERGFLDQAGLDAYRPLSEADKAGGSGRYAFRAFTLELRYQDGRVVRLSAAAHRGDAKGSRTRRIDFLGARFDRVQ